jgi:hypothetical protein
MDASTTTLQFSCISIDYELRLKPRSMDAAKKILVATGISVFDSFELFIGVRAQ